MSFYTKLYTALEPARADSARTSSLNIFIALVVLVSFLTLALETEPTISDTWREGIYYFNFVLLAIFALEYVARFAVAGTNRLYGGWRGRLRYVFTPYALADLVAFLPELIVIVFFPNSVNDDTLIMMRMLRLARLFKIARIFPAFEVMGAALKRAGSQLLTALTLALMLVYVSAVMLYLVEGVNGVPGTVAQENFNSIPRAIWWAVATLTTVGYGDVYPVTVVGRFFSSIIAIAGVGVVALPAGVFASAFTDELHERNAAKIAAAESKLKDIDHG